MTLDENANDSASVDEAPDAPAEIPARSVVELLACGAMRFVERASDAIAFVLARYPTQARLVIGSVFVLSMLMMFTHRAHAAALPPAPIPTGQSLLQDEINVVYDLETNWDIFDKALGLAATLFATLAILSVMVAGVSYYINYQSIKGLGQLVLTRVLSLGIPFLIITTAPTLFPLVALMGLHIADTVTGQSNAAVAQMPIGGLPSPDDVQNSLTNVFYSTWAGVDGYNQIAITPRNIVSEGVQIAWPLIQLWQKLSLDTNIPGTVPGAGGTDLNSAYFQQQNMIMGFVLTIAIGIIAMFTFIAVELILAYIQIYLVLPVAAFSLGFLGSPATRHFGAGYWNVVAQSLLRFVSIVFVIGFACVLAEKWNGDFRALEQTVYAEAKAGQDYALLKLAITAFVVTGSLFVIVRALPGMFAAVLFGGPGAGAEGLANSEGQFNAIGSRLGPGSISRTGRTYVPTPSSTVGQTGANK